MQFEQGRYFYLLRPKESGALYYLEPSGIYNEINSEGEIVSTKKTIFTRSVDLVPSFIYHVYETEPKGEKKSSKHLLQYPPTARYSRDGKSITIKPMEYRLEKESALIYRSKEFLYKEKISRTGQKVNIPDIFLEALKKNREGSIVLAQGDFEYSLETFPNVRKYSYTEDKTVEWTGFYYLSVKDILDGDGGLDRLIEDLIEARGSGLKFQGKKMGRLLDIIRSANDEQEEKILSALYMEDPPFFTEVTYCLFSDDLIPYMDKRELETILMKAPDSILATLKDCAGPTREIYKKLISKRRWVDLLNENTSGTSDQPELEKTAVWLFIESYFRKSRERTIYVKKRETPFLYRSGEASSIMDKTYSNPVSNMVSPISVISLNKEKVLINIEVALKKLEVVVKQSSGNFLRARFQKLSPGILQADFPLLTQKSTILLGGIDYENGLVETIAPFI
ncbi:MAG: hypothetical protein ABUK01_17340 [Leptospirales bacterium]